MLLFATYIPIWIMFFGLGGLVLSRGLRKPANITFFLFCVSISFWIFSLFLSDYLHDPVSVLVWTRLTWVGPILASTFFSVFSSCFPNHTLSIRKISKFFIPPIFLLIFTDTKWNIETVSIREWGSDLTVGKLYPVLFVFLIVYLIGALFNFIKAYKSSRTVEKSQIKLIVMGAFLSALIAFVTNILSNYLNTTRWSVFGPLAFTFFVVAVSIAIVKHRFLDVHIIIRRSLIYLSLASTVIIGYAGAVLLFQGVVSGGELHLSVIQISGIVFVALTAPLLQKWFERLTDRFFFRSAYNTQHTILDLAKKMNSVKSLDELDQQILGTLTETMKIKGAAIYRESHENGTLYKQVSEKQFGATELSLKKNLTRLRAYFATQAEVLVTEEVLRDRRDDLGHRGNLMLALCEDFFGHGVEVVVPLMAKEHLLGMIFLMGKKSGDAYSGQDLQLLEILANSASVAMDNAMFYEELEQRVQTRTTEVNEKNRYLMTLQRVTTQILQGVDFKEVTQKIVDAIHDEMGHVGAFIFSYKASTGETQLTAVSNARRVQEALSLMGTKAFEIKGNVHDNKLMQRVFETKEVAIVDKLREVLQPAISGEVADQMQHLARIKALAVVPIVVEGKAIGALTFLIDRYKDHITTAEQEIMHALAHLVAIVIRNSRYYDQVEKSNKQLARANTRINDQVIQLEEANKHLQRLDKAKTEFLSIASHQLRTPLSAIRGYLSLLEEGDFGEMAVQQKTVIKKMQDNVKRLVNLVNDLLSLARIEAGTGPKGLNAEEIDFRIVVDQSVDEVALKAQSKGLYLHWERPADEVRIKVDKEKIDQVVMNLIDNAVYYTLEGGVTITLTEEKKKIRFVVQDTGIGISKDNIHEMFAKFYRAQDAMKVRPDGTGIGLYVAKIMVESHNGKIWVESEAGKGSKFIVELPK